MALKFYWVDVFGEAPFSGNQLAVCMDAGRLSTAEMQMIAKETNFSETSFVCSSEERNGGFDVRIFTPDTEVPFAGHPTLGTAWVIREKLLDPETKQVRLNLKIGQIPVDFESDELLWMTQAKPTVGVSVDRDTVGEVLSLKTGDFLESWPSRIYDTGLPTLIVPVADLEALKRSKVSEAAYERLIEEHGKLLIMPICPGGYESRQTFAARVFCHCYGVVEDSATGSANGCLAAYLANEGVMGASSVAVVVGQGYEIGRPSSLYLDARKEGEDVIVKVGGKTRIVGEGVFEV